MWDGCIRFESPARNITFNLGGFMIVMDSMMITGMILLAVSIVGITIVGIIVKRKATKNG